MKGKRELKTVVDKLKAENIVVPGVAVEQNAIRAIIDEGDEEAKSTLESVASWHTAEVVHEGTEGGHEVYQLHHDESRELDF